MQKSYSESRQKPLFFFGHNKAKNGMDACFSNWFPAKFGEKGQQFENTEQYMMWHKALLFNDSEIAQKILQDGDPKTVKALGRKVRGFVQSVWDQNAQKIVYEGCLQKFTQNEELKKHLLSTGDRLLVEASPYDKIWGIGMNATDAAKTPQTQSKGTNWLGQCLVQVRETIRELEAEEAEVSE